jgi:sulfide:quinone oxidoreductase
VLATGDVVPADRVITIPILEGPRLAGLPADMHGFMPVDRHGRVQGVDDVFAAGDITNFPLKQGGLAAQQADAVAEAVAALASLPMEPRPFHPVIRGLLLTGAESVYLRAEPGAASRPDAPVGVIPSAFAESDRPLWWPPAKVAGRYLAPYLATARATRAADGTLVDRPATRAPARLVEHQEALELTLALADADAAWGDHASALRALDAAELLADVLPSEYEAKRRAWHAVLSG